MANYSVEYLERLTAALDNFKASFEAWMVTQDETDHIEARGLYPTVWTKDGQDPTRVQELELDVAQTAGLAARAVAVTGTLLAVKGMPGPLNAVLNWSMMANPRALISPRDIRTIVATTRGRLAAMIEDAQAASQMEMPAFSPALMHKVVWAGAAAHWPLTSTGSRSGRPLRP